MMLTIRGVYDGTTVRPLPSEPLPIVEGEVPVAIVFLEDWLTEEEKRQSQKEIARRMRAARDAMEPLGMSVKDLIEEGRER
jgi:hypothetical protein